MGRTAEAKCLLSIEIENLDILYCDENHHASSVLCFMVVYAVGYGFSCSLSLESLLWITFVSLKSEGRDVEAVSTIFFEKIQPSF